MPAASCQALPSPAAGAGVYRPRRPAATLLHRVVREHLETYLATAAGNNEPGRGVPPYVKAALREYLKCGILAHGFARVSCANCQNDFMVAFSCRGRDLCPSGATRRMAEVPGERATVCPAGHEAVQEIAREERPHRVEIVFASGRCARSPLYERCPARRDESLGGYVLTVDLVADNLERRRRREASGEFAKRYTVRAGIEATNSELKRKHGLGKLRVRGRPRVALAVCLKALACNLKRMVRAIRTAAAAGAPAGGPARSRLARLRPLRWLSRGKTEIPARFMTRRLRPRLFDPRGSSGGVAVSRH